MGKEGNGALICGNLRKIYNYAKTGDPIKTLSRGVAETVTASMVLKFGDNPAKGRGQQGVHLAEFKENL